MNGWIAVDLDGTLAEYHGWVSPTDIGAPVAAMVERVKRWLAEGRDVRIFTARAYPGPYEADHPGEVEGAIKAWCREHVGRELPVTYEKDYGMVEPWDDRAVQVVPNTGQRVDGRDG